MPPLVVYRPPFQARLRYHAHIWWLFISTLLTSPKKVIFEIFSPSCEKFAVEANRGSIIFDQKTEKIIFFQIFLKQTLLFLPKFEFYMKNAFFWCIYCWYSSKIAKLEIFRNFLVKLYYKGNFASFFCFLQKKNSENGSYELEMISAFRKMCFWSSVTLQS